MYKGVMLSVLASFTFGVLYFYTEFLKPLDSEQTFAWRMLSTLPFLTMFMWWSGDFNRIAEIFQRVIKQPRMLLWLLCSHFITTHTWFYGPINRSFLAVSLGSFKLPPCFRGWPSLKEQNLVPCQIAAILRFVRVSHEIGDWLIWPGTPPNSGILLFLRLFFKTDHLAVWLRLLLFQLPFI